MCESLLSVCWTHRTSELAPVYKSLLENNFLVDCTISAEGQNLKAHRLVLSASSSYFQELFSEETGKHAFVIVLNASFEILKAVIDFVYRGETQIPEGNLKSFLTLAQSLQIKGVQAFTQEYENNPSSSTENVPQDSCAKNQVTCEVQGVNASLVDSPENNHHSVGYTGAVSMNSSVPLKGYSVLCDQVRSSSVMMPLQEQWRQGADDVSTAMEITVKDELAGLEVRNEKLDNSKSDNPTSGNFTSNMDGETSSVCSEEDLNLISSCNETSHGNVEPSELPSSKQQLTQLEDQIPSGQDVAEERESLRPVVVVPKSEQLTIEENEELMDFPDESGNDMNESVEETGPATAEQNLDQSSRAVGFPLLDDLATHQRSGERVWSRGSPEESMTPVPHSELQLPHGQGEEPDPGATGRKALTSSSSLVGHKATGQRKHSCDVCGASFFRRYHLVLHNRKHTGERPYHCDVCGKRFAQSGTLSKHYRSHTGERPYHCDVCGKRFAETGNLTKHYRTHTGERYVCEMCGKCLTSSGGFIYHKRRHLEKGDNNASAIRH